MDDFQEEWKLVVGFPLYQVSDLGRVRRHPEANRVQLGLILKPRLKNGYPTICIRRDGKKYWLSVHRIVASAFLGPEPEGHEVNHLDTDKQNSVLCNLEYATPADNIRHAVEHGRYLDYRKDRMLTHIDVLYIRNNPDCLTGVGLAKKFQRCPTLISKIQHRKKYLHVA